MPGDGGKFLIADYRDDLLHGIFVADRDVDIGDFKVDGGNKFDTGDFGNSCEDLWGFPGVIGEGSASENRLAKEAAYTKLCTYAAPMPRTMFLLKVEEYWHSASTFSSKISALICAMAS